MEDRAPQACLPRGHCSFLRYHSKASTWPLSLVALPYLRGKQCVDWAVFLPLAAVGQAHMWPWRGLAAGWLGMK